MSHVTTCSFFCSFLLYIYIYHYPSFLPLFFFFCFQADLEPLFVYHPTSEEVSIAIGIPMKGFFNGADITNEPMAFSPTVAQGALVEAPIPLPRPSLIEKSAQIERVGEFTPIPIETPTSQKEVTPIDVSQTRSASLATPPVNSTSDPFAAFSQSIKDGFFLVVTPSSILIFATYGPNTDLSSDEGSEEVLEDDEDEPIAKKRVFDFDEDDGGEHETKAMGMCLLPLLNLLFRPVLYCCHLLFFFIYIYITS